MGQQLNRFFCYYVKTKLSQIHSKTLFTTKSFRLIPVMTLSFLHSILVSFQSLDILFFCCNPCHEHFLDQSK